MLGHTSTVQHWYFLESRALCLQKNVVNTLVLSAMHLNITLLSVQKHSSNSCSCNSFFIMFDVFTNNTAATIFSLELDRYKHFWSHYLFPHNQAAMYILIFIHNSKITALPISYFRSVTKVI